MLVYGHSSEKDLDNFPIRPASAFLTTTVIMRSRVQFPALPWGFFPDGEDPHGDHGLGNL
jgi:hypothetical protein